MSSKKNNTEHSKIHIHIMATHKYIYTVQNKNTDNKHTFI